MRYTFLMKQGNLRLPLTFREALTENVTVIAYAEFQNVIEIDRGGMVEAAPYLRRDRQRSQRDLRLCGINLC